MEINCIAIDDEPKALEIIEFHCSKIPFLNLISTFRDPLDAIGFLKSNEIHLIFLDINMPSVTGMQFLNLLKDKPMVIFVTAYSDYAIQSYEYDAIDYLLKPIAFDRFLKAGSKAFEKFQIDQKSEVVKIPAKSENSTGAFIYLKSGPKLHKIAISDILYLEKDGNYLIFHTPDKKILSRQNMKNIFHILPESKFLRIHRSFVISLEQIQTIESHQVTVGGFKIPIGSLYRDDLLNKIT
jgi:DNA-binding LytR/AlgR family response regulator